MLRRTKIVATLGPATDDDAVLAAMIANGLDVARLNFSHGGSDVLAKRCEQLRRLADEAQRQVAILGDLQGPKIRISRFVGGSADLPVGSAFFLDPELADRLHPNDLVRSSRGLEIFAQTGRRLSELQREHQFARPKLDALKIGLIRPRAHLHARVKARVDLMLEQGFGDEVRGLLERYGPGIKPMAALGY